ncbi:hypothetical protein MCUN1_000797 [Malassezia cuniculi]|uniref:SMP-LTD domain-containing protein n=1 Tax=Malassezia cuniculi TaxID=948313 RepID=A0AAF0ES12_9BASI|nr:hypothetical protein MCUN1_000797 [Malassezia cuniculi]
MLRDILFYLLGGVTFLPLCLLSAFVLFSIPLEKDAAEQSKRAPLDPTSREDGEKAAVEHLADNRSSKLLATWLVVKQSPSELPPKSSLCFGRDGKPKQWRGSSGDDDERSRGAGTRKSTTGRDRSSAMFYDTGIPGGIDSNDESASDSGLYYGILRPPVLYLYNSENITRPGSECIAAIDLRQKRVSLWIRDSGSVESSEEARVGPKESELFSKRNAIHIISFGDAPEPARIGIEAQWFIMAPRTSLQEDWYHAMVSASLMAPGRTTNARAVDPVGELFSTGDMRQMVKSLDNVPDPIPLRWLNALVGRVFFSIYRTAALEKYILRKWTEKIVRMRIPKILSDVRLTSVDIGHSPPSFSRPMLKTLTADGHASMEMCIHFQGTVRVTFSAVLNLSLGQRFKTYRVPIVLAVNLSELDGNVLLLIKPPPSNRLWWGFTTMPEMKIDIEPVVSERRVSWSFVNGIIRNRIRESIADTLVLPHMDDVAFFDTSEESRRGGIWRESGRNQPEGSSFRAFKQPSSAPLKPMPSTEDLAQARSIRVDTSVGSKAAEGLSSLLQQSDKDEQSPKSASSTKARFNAFKESLQDRRRSVASACSRTSQSPEKPSARDSSKSADTESLDDDQFTLGDISESGTTTPSEDQILSSVPDTKAPELPSRLLESIMPDSPSRSREASISAEVPPAVPRRPSDSSSEKSQEGPPLPPRMANVVRTQQTTSSIISSWSQRAKASLADRDARQEAAREAKNAIKRGWNAWNNRNRTDRPAQPPAPPQRPTAEPPTFVLQKPNFPSAAQSVPANNTAASVIDSSKRGSDVENANASPEKPRGAGDMSTDAKDTYSSRDDPVPRTQVADQSGAQTPADPQVAAPAVSLGTISAIIAESARVQSDEPIHEETKASAPQRVANVTPAKLDEPINLGGPAVSKPANPAEPAEPTEPAAPTEPTEPTEPAEPTSSKPVQPSKPGSAKPDSAGYPSPNPPKDAVLEKLIASQPASPSTSSKPAPATPSSAVPHSAPVTPISASRIAALSPIVAVGEQESDLEGSVEYPSAQDTALTNSELVGTQPGNSKGRATLTATIASTNDNLSKAADASADDKLTDASASEPTDDQTVVGV